ncbi:MULTISPECIES: DUF885 family protein [unclassified Novosphingobium]|uniref:DUF885 domain-containing protein n=1 Tax=unclassified Novosphingobium TaxID=2644732 RepID=UPI00146D0440|nr:MULTISPECIES: DUF885 family protein [unclassified Novosphingobium]NMN02880.1 uncharacterized protein (DUF885 family) [Novosphingobium sp. SG919]NMN87133.1 uncharacterized protein (DUF885 family) [Novosphingobium sp. SG916]
MPFPWRRSPVRDLVAGLLLAGAIAPAVLPTTAMARPAGKAAASSEDARFAALTAAEWAWRKTQFPDDEDSGTHGVPRLPDVRAAAQAARLRKWEDVRAQLDKIETKRLSPANQVNAAIYRYQIGTLISAQRYREYEKPLNADTNFWGDLADSAREAHLRSEADYTAYIAMLRDVPRYFDQQIANMRAGLARGFTPPQITLQGRDDTILPVTAAPKVEDNPFYAPFVAMPDTIPADRQAALREEARAALAQAVVPAHQRLLQFLKTDYIPRARTRLDAYSLPDGQAYYQAQIREYTTLDLTPAQIHQIGLDEVAQIRRQMQAVMQDVHFQGDLPAFLQFLRSDPQFYVKTPQALLDRAAWIAKEFDGKAADWFGHLPRRRFAIVPVPDAIAPYYTAGRGGPGVYLVNTYNLPSRPLYSLPALTLHESAPGHAFQMPLAAENKGLPPFRQNSYISAFGEGWALYCEKLGEDMGMYHTPYERFGMLSYQMWRAARLVVDTGIHTMGWSRAQAQQFLHDNTALSDHEIETETDRYIAWPGQALSYYLGERAILEARARAQKALGPKFNIRAFHDTVLQLGSVPLPVLDAAVDRFIAQGGKGPYPDEE